MEGFYYDSFHGHCLRRVRRTGTHIYAIDGVFGDDEAPRTHRRWTATMRVVADDGIVRRLRVDFAGKVGKAPRYMFADYHRATRSLRWIEDGNVWRKLYVHPSQFGTTSAWRSSAV